MDGNTRNDRTKSIGRTYQRNLLKQALKVSNNADDTEREKNNNTINSKLRERTSENIENKYGTEKIKEGIAKSVLPAKRSDKIQETNRSSRSSPLEKKTNKIHEDVNNSTLPGRRIATTQGDITKSALSGTRNDIIQDNITKSDLHSTRLDTIQKDFTKSALPSTRIDTIQKDITKSDLPSTRIDTIQKEFTKSALPSTRIDTIQKDFTKSDLSSTRIDTIQKDFTTSTLPSTRIDTIQTDFTKSALPSTRIDTIQKDFNKSVLPSTRIDTIQKDFNKSVLPTTRIDTIQEDIWFTKPALLDKRTDNNLNDILKAASPIKHKIKIEVVPKPAAPVEDVETLNVETFNNRTGLHRTSTIDMLDIQNSKRGLTTNAALLTERHGKLAVEFIPTQPKTKSDQTGEVFKCVYIQLSDKTDKKFKIETKMKSRREQIEDLKKKSMRKCGSDSIEHSAVYLSMLESYDAVLGNDIFEHSITQNNPDEASVTHEHRVLECRMRTLSDFEKEAFLRRDLVLTELLDSEKNYVEDLTFIVEKYIPLMTEENVTEDLVYSCDSIYMNIVEIHAFHVQTFHEEIEKCFENPDLIDTAFTTHEERLTELYTLYCSQKPVADELLKEYGLELDGLLHRMFPDIKLRAKDFLIKPVQRLMKYQLLLTSIKKYGVKAGKPSTYLVAAIESMERVPKEANDAMHVGLITGYDGSGCSVEQLMNHGQLEVAVGNRKARIMHVFLFETVCLFTEKASKLVPEYKCIYFDDNSGLGFTSSNNLGFVIIFRKHTKSDIYKCEAETEDDKEQWTCKIREAMSFKDMQKRKMSVRRQLTIEIAPSDEEKASSNDVFQTLVIEEAVIKAMVGHPRLGIMSERLKCNIENYIATEFIIPLLSDKDKSSLSRHKTVQRGSATLPNLPRGSIPDNSTDQRRSVSPPRRKGKKSKKDREREAAKRLRSKSLINF